MKGIPGSSTQTFPSSNPGLLLADPKTVSEALGGLTEEAGWAGPAYRLLRLMGI